MTADHVAQVVSRWTGIPVDRMLEGEREKLLKMEQQIGKRVVGQAEAVKSVSTAVRRARAGLQDPHRPIGSFMFLGPTGVGKTELTKALAEFLFDDEQALIRIDMSEYMEKHSVARLIGAPPGYVGYDEGGALTEAVRRRPYQVVLFDEIEKAHPDVFNVLLQVLDDGRLTDGQGRTVDFRNTLIVMTSNLGAEYLVAQPEGQDTEAVRDQVMAEVRARFRPEFLNRVDEIILFHRLKREHMGRIVDIQMVRLAKLLEDRKIAIALDAKARDWLADKGYDPAYGARPLKRAIQKSVQDPLAELILSGKVKDGDKVAISANRQGITFNGEAVEAGGVIGRNRTRGGRRGPLNSACESSHAEVCHELHQIRPAAGREDRPGRAPALDRVLARDPVARARHRAGVVGVDSAGYSDALISITAIVFGALFRGVVRQALVHPLDHRIRGDRPARDLQAWLHHTAHRRDEHGQGRVGGRRPVDPGPDARLRDRSCHRDRRLKRRACRRGSRWNRESARIASPLALRNAITAK